MGELCVWYRRIILNWILKEYIMRFCTGLKLIQSKGQWPSFKGFLIYWPANWHSIRIVLRGDGFLFSARGSSIQFPDLKCSMYTLIDTYGFFVWLFTIRPVARNEGSTPSNLSVLGTNCEAVSYFSIFPCEFEVSAEKVHCRYVSRSYFLTHGWMAISSTCRMLQQPEGTKGGNRSHSQVMGVGFRWGRITTDCVRYG